MPQQTGALGSRRNSTSALRKLLKVVTWSPFGKQPWYFHLFNSLWVWATVVVLMLSLPSWLGHPVSFPSQRPDESQETMLKEPDWNAPLPIGEGLCIVVTTRQIVEC